MPAGHGTGDRAGAKLNGFRHCCLTGAGAFGRTQAGQAVWREGLWARLFSGRPCDLPGCARGLAGS